MQTKVGIGLIFASLTALAVSCGIESQTEKHQAPPAAASLLDTATLPVPTTSPAPTSTPVPESLQCTESAQASDELALDQTAVQKATCMMDGVACIASLTPVGRIVTITVGGASCAINIGTVIYNDGAGIAGALAGCGANISNVASCIAAVSGAIEGALPPPNGNPIALPSWTIGTICAQVGLNGSPGDQCAAACQNASGASSSTFSGCLNACYSDVGICQNTWGKCISKFGPGTNFNPNLYLTGCFAVPSPSPVPSPRPAQPSPVPNAN